MATLSQRHPQPSVAAKNSSEAPLCRAPAPAPLSSLRTPGPSHAESYLSSLQGIAPQTLAPQSSPPAWAAPLSAPTGIVLAGSMKMGSMGKNVSQLQTFLGLEADGKFGPKTTGAVKQWQEAHGLKPDGKIGPKTLAALADGATGVSLNRSLRTGAKGSDVEQLQRYLKLPADGKYGPNTRAAVIQFQMDHGLVPDGIIGDKTRAALANTKEPPSMAGGKAPQEKPAKSKEDAVVDELTHDPKLDKPTAAPVYEPKGELRSRWHNNEKFVPKFASTAYSESSVFRGKNDPYAVGAISKPSRRQDLGGKSYGTYQFESSIYKNGSTRGKNAVNHSTLMRFIRSKENPYAAELGAVVKKYGVGTRQFDAAWKRLSAKSNKGFGRAQEAFMEKENERRFKTFFNRINASKEAQDDPRLKDLVMGTNNQYGGLSKGIAQYAGAHNKNGKMSADQLGKLIQDHKRANVKRNFRSSPGSQKGVYNRIAREKAMFK